MKIWLCLGITFEKQGVRYPEFMDLIWYLVFVQHFADELLELIFTIVWSMCYVA